LNAPAQEAKVVDSQAIERYHDVCYWDPSECRYVTASTTATITLGVVVTYSPGDQLEDAAEIAFLPDVAVAVGNYQWGVVLDKQVVFFFYVSGPNRILSIGGQVLRPH
jgi:hypothetical protein